MSGLILHAAGDQSTTTLYVGRHFEVRDHDQPVKYVFDADTRIARVTGSLSVAPRIQRLRLLRGWNLVSLAVTATNAVEQLSRVANGGIGIDEVYYWDAAAGAFSAPQPGQTVATGSVLWLRTTTSYVATLVGQYVEPQGSAVVSGDSFVANPGWTAWSLDLPASVEAWRFDAAARVWQGCLSGELSPLNQAAPTVTPGEAVYIHAETPSEVLLPAPAARITWYHPDHLGSSTVVTDVDGSRIEETAFYPAGTPRNRDSIQAVDMAYGFDQKERDPESDLLYFGRRYLCPTLGLWLSVDPLGESGGGADPYAYVNRNPLKLRDPDGADITVAEKIDEANKTITYQISVKAALIDTSKAFGDQKIADYAGKLKAQIEGSFKGTGVTTLKKGNKAVIYKTTYTTTVNLRVISDWGQVQDDDHVFWISDNSSTGAGGESHTGGKLINVRSEVLRRPTPDQWDKVPPIDPRLPWDHFHSPEAVGAHELGHTAGLSHQSTKKNLMTDGQKQRYENVELDTSQLRTIVDAYKSNKLNQRDPKLDALTKKR